MHPSVRHARHTLAAIASVVAVQMIASAHVRSTLLPLPHPMIVAGSRFRELYYWDSFWTLKGLLASGMRGCALDMVNNFLHLIDQHGFVPNGSRVCLLARSMSPPYVCSSADIKCWGCA